MSQLGQRLARLRIQHESDCGSCCIPPHIRHADKARMQNFGLELIDQIQVSSLVTTSESNYVTEGAIFSVLSYYHHSTKRPQYDGS